MAAGHVVHSQSVQREEGLVILTSVGPPSGLKAPERQEPRAEQ